MQSMTDKKHDFETACAAAKSNFSEAAKAAAVDVFDCSRGCDFLR